MEKKKTIIHFVRHGEVENPRSVRYGRLPGFHLSAKGRAQVAKTSEFFVKRPIAAILTSPLERTQQTATLLGLILSHVPIYLDPLLLEVKTLHKFEGHSRDLAFYYPLKHTAEAETKEEVLARFERFIEQTIVHYHSHEVIAVTHGDPMAIAYDQLVYDHAYAGANEAIAYPPYASIYSFVFLGLDLQSVWIQAF